ncbi:hypothetical protein IWX76_001279 [Pedobacter sp. CAN_A7]
MGYKCVDLYIVWVIDKPVVEGQYIIKVYVIISKSIAYYFLLINTVIYKGWLSPGSDLLYSSTIGSYKNVKP